MPQTPHTSLFTRYVLENPFPLGLVLLAAAAVIGWLALREGLATRQKLALALAGLGAVVLAVGSLVTTAGEHGEQVAEQLVDRAVAGDVNGAMALFASDASLAVGSPRNPGVDVSVIQSGLTRLANRYKVEHNIVSDLDAYTIAADEARVDLTCLTDVGYGYTPSQWSLEVRRQSDGSWLISRITWLSVSQRTPSLDMAR